jgi:putative two-component system response regulator
MAQNPTIANDAALTRARVVIVDDQEANVLLLERLLELSGFVNFVATTDSKQAVALCAEEEPDIVLLDLQMPPPDGFEVMEQLAPWTRDHARVPILVLTADATPETKLRALAAGASDFVSKPFDATEVVLRIKNLLTTRLLQRELRDHNALLEERVGERTRDLEEARLEILERLALAAEFRDDATGEHTQRVGLASGLVASELGLPSDTVELIRRAAPLHDVGKVGVSDAILLKPGKLTPVEFEAMKLHTTIGGEILGGSRSRLLQVAEEIALTHHERWDGSGYPSGLGGESIPITGRIVAVVDVFDALTHERPYKRAWPVERALAEIRTSSGEHFDPRVVEAFTALDPAAVLDAPRRLGLVA